MTYCGSKRYTPLAPLKRGIVEIRKKHNEVEKVCGVFK
jgi:hypothetical protein